MVFALENLAESAFANEFIHLKSVADLVTIDDAIVALGIVKAIIYEALKLGRGIFLVLLGEIEYFIVFGNLCHFMDGKVLFGT